MDHDEEGRTNAGSDLREVSSVKPRFAGLYREDVVQSSTNPLLRGMVTKVAGDSDSDSSSDSEEQDDDSAIAQGCARVCWINSEESTERIADICVVDRAFLHGDIVALVASPHGQTGTVVNVDLLVDLELHNGEVLREVDSRKLKQVRAFAVGDYVIKDHWLGRVDEVVDNVTVMFDDGSKCKLMRADPVRLSPVPESPIDDSGCPYYPGQRVRASSATFKGSRWLRGCWKPNRTEGVVTDVEVGSVVVYWIAAAHAAYVDQSTTIPSEQQDPKGLRAMAHLSYTNWQLGDRALLPKRFLKKVPSTYPAAVDGFHSEGDLETLPGNDGGHGVVLDSGTNFVSGIKELPPDNWVALRRKLRRRFTRREKRTQRKDEVIERALLVVNTKTKVDVVWQDGTLNCGLDAPTLFPVDHLGDHDFWPEQHVIERGSELEGFESETRRVGIVKSVDSKQRIAKVRWLRQVDHTEEPCELQDEEVVSVYGLIEHPDYNYCIGDVVIRLSSASELPGCGQNSSQQDELISVPSLIIDEKTEVKHLANGEILNVGEMVSGKGRKGKMEGKAKSSPDLSWVGVIIGLHDGDIEVAWADGSVSNVGPQAIFVVGRDEDDESTQSGGIEDAEEGDDVGSWETVDSRAHELETEEEELDHSEFDERGLWEQYQGSGNNLVQSVGIAETLLEGQSLNVATGWRESSSLQTSSPLMGGVLSLPLVALVRAFRFAAGFLWSFGGAKRESFMGESTGISVSQRQPIEKHGLEKLMGEGTTNGQVESMEELQQHLVENSPSSTWDASRVFDTFSTGIGENEDSTELITVPHDGRVSPEVDATNALQREPFLPDVNEMVPVGSQSVETDLFYCGGFKWFDIVRDSTDHHFLNETGQPSSQRKWAKRVQQDWGILEKNIPETIYVRVYEDRMDLLRSVIIGAAGTPYHDGLFFFDFYLPPEYPNVPPLAHYHSGGLRLNPNLYETGKVCLSLLNTWTGKGNEVWHPSTSSILQVLVSIQGLVLNVKPYFNEAGYDKQIGTAEGEKNSLAYSENSFLLSCKSMLYLLRRPPKHFEVFVWEHFKQRGAHILHACNAYMQGCPVGALSEDATVSPMHGSSLEQSSSIGFRLMLAKLIPRLVAAFTEVGANCGQCTV